MSATNLVGVRGIDQKIYIEVSHENLDEIVKYMDLIEAETVQDAIMNAISLAFDDQDK